MTGRLVGLRRPATTATIASPGPRAACVEMRIHGIEGMSDTEVRQEIERGAKFVVFDWCVSALFITYRLTSEVHFIRPEDNPVVRSLPYTLTSLLLGWWGVPSGPAATISAVRTNLRGGREVTPTFGDGSGRVRHLEPVHAA
jgi:hypothetical protein